MVEFDLTVVYQSLPFCAAGCDGLQECIFNGQWLNNLDLAGTTVQYPNGQSYRMHGGFYRAWTGNLKSHAMTALKTAVAKYPPSNHSGLYVSGHSRGGAFANLAAMDIFFDAAQLGFTSPSSQIRLITLGQPRVGDANFAKLVQNSLGTRYRVVTNADVVTAVPPASDDWVLKALYLLGTFASDIENALNSANCKFMLERVCAHSRLYLYSRSWNAVFFPIPCVLGFGG